MGSLEVYYYYANVYFYLLQIKPVQTIELPKHFCYFLKYYPIIICSLLVWGQSSWKSITHVCSPTPSLAACTLSFKSSTVYALTKRLLMASLYKSLTASPTLSLTSYWWISLPQSLFWLPSYSVYLSVFPSSFQTLLPCLYPPNLYYEELSWNLSLL